MINDMIAWILDCQGNDKWVRTLSTRQLEGLIERNYVGGLAQFIMDGA